MWSWALTRHFRAPTRSLKLFLINGGYPLIAYSVIGILVAPWT